MWSCIYETWQDNDDLNINGYTFQLKFLTRQSDRVTNFAIGFLTMDSLLFTTLAAAWLTATSLWQLVLLHPRLTIEDKVLEHNEKAKEDTQHSNAKLSWIAKN